ELALLAVPRQLSEKSNEALDPSWLKPAPPPIVPLFPYTTLFRSERSSALHRYRVDKTEDGLKLTLLNPDVLKPYPPERIGGAAENPRKDCLWAVLAGGALVLTLGAWLVWRSQRVNPQTETGA